MTGGSGRGERHSGGARPDGGRRCRSAPAALFARPAIRVSADLKLIAKEDKSLNGKEIRLKRLFKRSDRLLVVPLDHGVSMGPVEGLKEIGDTIRKVAQGGADAVVVHKGLARHAAPFAEVCELIVHLSASTELAPDPNRKELVATPEFAARLGASAVSTHVNLASREEAAMLKDLGRAAEACALLGLPLLAMMYVRDGRKESEYDPKKLAHAARVAEELGADVVKVNYTGSVDSFAEVVSGVTIPVVIAGGPKAKSAAGILRTVRDAVLAGAKGVALGRNIFQHKDPEAMTRAVRRALDGPLGDDEIDALVAKELEGEARERD